MKISVLATFPELFQPFLSTSLIKRAIQNGHVSVELNSFFSYAEPKERIDAPTFGHGAGMLIKPAIVEKAIADIEAKQGRTYRVFFSPHGKKLTQPVLHELAAQKNLLLVCGRYEGMDARVEQTYADLILSIGDYVVMGGELPAMVFMEGLLRLVPGVVGREESVRLDSYQTPFVDHPEYTEPVTWQGKEVPAVVRSGNHGAIRAWQQEVAAERTVVHHFDWFRSSPLTDKERELGLSKIPPHYTALMHSDVLIGANDGQTVVGNSSVTSLDIHDIARSARTYGIQHYFIVTPLQDQAQIVQTLLDFWQTGVGLSYKPQRSDAVKSVSIAQTLDQAVAEIEAKEGKRPILVATSARDVVGIKNISYSDQELVWSQNRPVLLIFGTARGLSQELLMRCDYVLQPVKGFSNYQHLSVRSAAAVVFDRWLGWNQSRNLD